MTRRGKGIALAGLLVTLFCRHAGGQTAPTTILEIDVENLVEYQEDTTDLSKFATNPSTTIPVSPRNFNFRVGIGDIVAVNGQRVKGTVTRNIRQVFLRTAPTPGQAAADIVRNGVLADSFEILKDDGALIGTIVTYGNAAGSASVGAPLSITQGNFAIVGGTGAFLGVRGQYGNAVSSQTTAIRQASVTEDPANRRPNGGGRVKFVLQVIPMSRPEIVGYPILGPAVTHADGFTQVTWDKPAMPGEQLSLFATSLGPTRPGVDPGALFPSTPPAVNSPVEVIVNGKSAEVLAAVGVPGTVERYQVDFRLPPDTPRGFATVQLRVAWILGSAVAIPIR